MNIHLTERRQSVEILKLSLYSGNKWYCYDWRNSSWGPDYINNAKIIAILTGESLHVWTPLGWSLL